MRALVPLVAAAAVLAACGSAGSAGTATASRTSLTVTTRAEAGAPAVVRTLRCDPAGGTVARPARACARLAALDRPFAPTPRDVACTELYGGPQTATVRGTFRGRRIWARFSRVDGCAIERWDRHAFLFPSGLAGAGPS